jgi:nucleoside diphosphate kinase
MLQYEILSLNAVQLDVERLISQVQSRIKKRSNRIAKLNMYAINHQACNILGDEQKYDKNMYHELIDFVRIRNQYEQLL